MLQVRLPKEEERAPLLRKYPGQIDPQPAYLELTEEGEVFVLRSGEISRTTIPERVFNGRSTWFSITPYLSGSAVCDLLGDENLLKKLEDFYISKKEGRYIDEKYTDISSYLSRIEPDISGPYMLEEILEGEDPSDIREELERIWHGDAEAYAQYLINENWDENRYYVIGDGEDIINYIKRGEER